MKKTSKMFGAVVLSAALAAGMAMPAFAAPTAATGADSDAITEAGDSNSVVNLVSFKDAGDPEPVVPEVPGGTYSRGELMAEEGEGSLNDLGIEANYQMIANIPVSATVATPQKGGTLTTPTNYSIKNRGYSDVFVNNVTATAATGWDLSRAAVTGKNAMYLDLVDGMTTVQLPAADGTPGGAVADDFEVGFNGTATQTIKQAVNADGQALYLVYVKPSGTVANTTAIAEYVTKEELENDYYVDMDNDMIASYQAGVATIDCVPTLQQLNAISNGSAKYQPVMVPVETRTVSDNALTIGLSGEAFTPLGDDEAKLDETTASVMRITYTIAPSRD